MAKRQVSELDRKKSEALGRAVQRCTVALSFQKGRGRSLFSGSLIQFRQRYFILTVRHAAEKIETNEEAVSLRMFRTDGDDGILEFGLPLIRNIFFPADDQPIKNDWDVAVMELDEGYARDLNCDWIDELRLTSAGIEPHQSVVIRGIAGKLHADGSAERLPVSYETLIAPIPPPELLDYALDGNDVFAYYDPQASQNALTGSLAEPPHPGGMSGGAFFAMPDEEEGEVWSPGRAHLIAVQMSYPKRAKMLRGKRIELVKRDMLPQIFAEEGWEDDAGE